MPKAVELASRFWSKVDIKSRDECWPWTASRSREGYGMFRVAKAGESGAHMTGAHRVAYTLYIGEIPPGFQIDHLCRVRECVNPYHLDAVSQRENLLRGNGLPGINHRKTHCLRGHPLEGDNIKYKRSPRGRLWRACRTCDVERQRRNYRAAREKKGSGHDS